jgi:hypothetical protein
MIGDINVVEDPADPPELYRYAVLISFATIEEFRRAVELGTARFWPPSSGDTK